MTGFTLRLVQQVVKRYSGRTRSKLARIRRLLLARGRTPLALEGNR